MRARAIECGALRGRRRPGRHSRGRPRDLWPQPDRRPVGRRRCRSRHRAGRHLRRSRSGEGDRGARRPHPGPEERPACSACRTCRPSMRRPGGRPLDPLRPRVRRGARFRGLVPLFRRLRAPAGGRAPGLSCLRLARGDAGADGAGRLDLAQARRDRRDDRRRPGGARARRRWGRAGARGPPPAARSPCR